MRSIVLKEECYRVMGACFEVYREKGCGFLEAVYQECLELELDSRGIGFSVQKTIPLKYKGQSLRQVYRADLICLESVLVEVKAVEKVADEHRAQVLNYLNAADLHLGLLVNFGHRRGLEWERFVR